VNHSKIDRALGAIEREAFLHIVGFHFDVAPFDGSNRRMQECR
jgi:hypothetical protein